MGGFDRLHLPRREERGVDDAGPTEECDFQISDCGFRIGAAGTCRAAEGATIASVGHVSAIRKCIDGLCLPHRFSPTLVRPSASEKPAAPFSADVFTLPSAFRDPQSAIDIMPLIDKPSPNSKRHQGLIHARGLRRVLGRGAQGVSTPRIPNGISADEGNQHPRPVKRSTCGSPESVARACTRICPPEKSSGTNPAVLQFHGYTGKQR